jgi:hypothetical protein
MDLNSITPLVIYDNQCYHCTRFARIVNFLARGKLTFVGHYSEMGKKLRDQFLDSSALEMFWFIDGKTAYGGRAAILPMFISILSFKETNVRIYGDINFSTTECKNTKAFFARTKSLLKNNKKIPISKK